MRLSYGGYICGDFNLPDRCAFIKCGSGNLGKTGADGNGFKTLTVFKCRITHFGDGIGNGYRLNSGASEECAHSDGGKAFRKGKLGNAVGVVKGIILDGFDRRGEVKSSQSLATGKCTFADDRNAFAPVYLGQRNAIFKCSFTERGKVCAEGNFRKGGTAVKSIVVHSRKTVSEVHGAKTCAIFKGVVFKGLKAVGQGYLLYALAAAKCVCIYLFKIYSKVYTVKAGAAGKSRGADGFYTCGNRERTESGTVGK